MRSFSALRRSGHRRSRAVAALTTSVLISGLLVVAVPAPASAAAAPVGAGFTVTPGDLAFILKQIKIAERHATTLTSSNPCGTLLAQPGDGIPDTQQVPDILTSYGLRTVDGSCNNLGTVVSAPAPDEPVAPPSGNPNPSYFGSSSQVFPRLTTPVFRSAEPITADLPVGPPGPTSYAQKTGSVVDSQPRLISNLIDDQTSTNPAAVAAALRPIRSQHPDTPTATPCTTDPDPLAAPPTEGVPAGCTPSHDTLFIPNISTNSGLSPPYNSLFTFFGQFFDHGLDQTVKSGSSVFIPLQADDPLIAGPDHVLDTADDLPPPQRFMVLTRAQNQPGADGLLGTADDVQDASNTDTPWVDQSQTYSSHAAHQVFLREYEASASGPVSDGRLLQGIANDDALPCQKPAPFSCYSDGPAGPGSLATWASIRKQAHDLLGLRLADEDVLNVPMIATDPYGKFLPGPHGLPQYVTATGLIEGRLDVPSTPGDETVPVPSNVIYFDTPFIGDISHNADPSPDPQTHVSPAPDADSTIQTDFTKQQAGTYDDELLATHFACGDGRCNENIALTAIHQVFHSEHDRLVADIDNVLKNDISPAGVAALADWRATGVTDANGAGGYGYGERLFQAARFVTEMQYQHLVFGQFARKVQPAVRAFRGYTPALNPAIDTEFAQAVYRFGHSMLDDTVARTTVDPFTETRTNDSLPLLGAFLNPPAYFQSKTGTLTPRQAAGSVIMGSSDQAGNEIDEFVTETLRNNLLGLPLDLPAINIARARETGVAPLNDVRRQLFAETHDPQLTPYTSWSDFGQHLKHPGSLINFVAAYGTHPSIVSATTAADKRAAARAIVDPTPNDTPPADAGAFMFGTGPWAGTPTGLDSVDLWVGGLAEVTNQNGGMLGSTFNYVFQTQMEMLQDNDRFYYLARTAGLNLLSELEADTFAELFERNTDGTSTLKADAFATTDCKFELANITAPAPAGSFNVGPGSVADDPASTCNENKLLLRKPDGTIQYRLLNPVDASGFNGQSVYNGTSSSDKVIGGIDDDTIWGNGGNDVLEGSNGNDTLFGGDGNDVETDSAGADVVIGGPGNDALDGGLDNDLVLGGDGSDLLNGGANDNQDMGGPGNDYIIAGQGADTAFGDSGDDWLEGGAGQDLLQGDHGAPFFDDPGEIAPGKDIFIGQPGENTYDAEGGDDIMEQSTAVDGNLGSAGFDWAAHQYDTTPVDDDMMVNNNQGGLPVENLANRDLWRETEADSGGPFDDVIKGTEGALATPRLIGGAGFSGCDAIDQAGLARIPGLAALLPPVAQWPGNAAQTTSLAAQGRCPLAGPVWGEGDILLGGPGNDTLTGRAGSDVIDGDKELRIAISITDGDGQEIGRTDLLEDTATSGNFGPGTDGMTLQQAVFAGLVDPGNLVNVREIVDNVTAPADCKAVSPLNCDTSLYAGPRSQYTITQNPNGSVTVTDPTSTTPAGALGDGSDTLFHIEQLRFADRIVDLTAPPEATAPGAPTIGTATPRNASATITWTQPASNGGSPITRYSVRVLGPARTPVGALRSTAGGTATSLLITGLVNGTAYTFVVSAVNAVGIGAASASSAPVTPRTTPRAPTIGTVTRGAASATVRWRPPTDNGGSAIAAYWVRAINATTGVQSGVLRRASASASSLLVRGLTNRTRYRFQVAAGNAAGIGTFSAVSASVIPASTPSAPIQHRAVSGLPGGGISATAVWSPPINNGGYPIIGYVVRALRLSASGAVLTTTILARQPASHRSVSVQLVPGNYRFTVQAVNAIGAGTQSARSNLVTAR